MTHMPYDTLTTQHSTFDNLTLSKLIIPVTLRNSPFLRINYVVILVRRAHDVVDNTLFACCLYPESTVRTHMSRSCLILPWTLRVYRKRQDLLVTAATLNPDSRVSSQCSVSSQRNFVCLTDPSQFVSVECTTEECAVLSLHTMSLRCTNHDPNTVRF